MVEYSLVLQSSTISKAPSKTGSALTHGLLFFRLSRQRKTECPRFAYLYPRPASVTNLIHSATFFLASTPHIIVDRSSPAIVRILTQCLRDILEVAGQVPLTYIIVDALDECPDTLWDTIIA